MLSVSSASAGEQRGGASDPAEEEPAADQRRETVQRLPAVPEARETPQDEESLGGGLTLFIPSTACIKG